MILGMEIALLVLGILALATGKLTLTRTRVVRGWPARLLGLLAILPLPLCFLVGFILGFITVARGQPFDVQAQRLTLSLIEAGITLLCLVALYGIGWFLADDLAAEVEPSRRRRRRSKERDPEPRDEIETRDRPPEVTAPPAPVVVLCPGCKSTLAIRAEHAGQHVRCPKCLLILCLPGPPPTTTLPAATAITESPPAMAQPPHVPPPPEDGERRPRKRLREADQKRAKSRHALVLGLPIGGIFFVLSAVGTFLAVRATRPGSMPVAVGQAPLPASPARRPVAIPNLPAPADPVEKAAVPPAAIQPMKGVPNEPALERHERPNPPTALPWFPVDPALENASGKVYLSDLQEFATTQGPMGWSFAKNGNLGCAYEPGAMVRVNGLAYAKGLNMVPPWNDYIRVCYRLGKRANRLAGAVAINDGDPFGPPPTRFAVLGDGKLLWRSDAVKSRSLIQAFDLDASEVAVLELRVYTEHGNPTGARAVWLDPHVLPK